MLRSMRRFSFVLALVSLAAAGPAWAAPLPQVQAWTASGRPKPPPQRSCPGVANLDLKTMAGGARGPAKPGAGLVTLPPAAEALIPADATVVLRAHMPPGGLYNSDVKSAVWKEADGTWKYWRQSKDYSRPPPPPPMPPLPGTPEAEHWQPPPPPTEDELFPPVTGRLNPERAQRLEAALNDPCRAWDPDYYPWKQPLLRAEEGWGKEKQCPPDGGYYAADFKEPGRERRGIGAGCINDTPTFRIISAVAYAGG